MFCGLPMIVATDPVLDAKQKPSRNGTGLRPRASVTATSSGVIATTTTSLVSSDESTAEVPMRTASNVRGPTSSVATRAAAQA